MKLFNRFAAVLTLIFVSNAAGAQVLEPPFLKFMDHPWVDSVMNRLSAREKIGQLIWVAAFADRDLSYSAELGRTVEEFGLGGVIFFQGNSVNQAEIINHLRSVSRIPPMVATDGEWGIGMRLTDVGSFPYQMTLGAVSDNSLIYRMGKSVAGQMKRAGVNINLAPVADVNNNSRNPVINYRSFGENPLAVSEKVAEYMKGMQDNGIFAVAKHFPGHGDTEIDSHLDLPVIRHSRERLDSVELPPFRRLIENGISGVMPGHLSITGIEEKAGLPSTVSPKILTGLLKNDLQFKGLILSDAMNMGGLTKNVPEGEAEVLALLAGIDVLEYVNDPAKALSSIETAVKSGKLSQSLIDEKCRKVLAAKYWAGLSRPEPVVAENISSELFGKPERVLNMELYSSAITLLGNEGNLIPLIGLDTLKIATLSLNSEAVTKFQERAGSYTRCDHFVINDFSEKEVNRILKETEGYNLIIAGIGGTGWRSSAAVKDADKIEELISKINQNKKLIVAFFGNPYQFGKMEKLHGAEGLLLCYQENSDAMDAAAQIIFGAYGAKGHLPVTVSENFTIGSGIVSEGGIRLRYTLPESAGVSSLLLEKKVDSIALSGIEKMAYPGCEIMIARKGEVIFHKTYGFQTYENRVAVEPEDLFDLASVTKISSTMAGLLLLDSENSFTPDKRLGEYLPQYQRSNKGDMLVREMLAHQAGLTAWIPFWRQTVNKNGEFKNGIFSKCESKIYPLKVADELYINRNYRSKIFREIRKSPVKSEKKYLYSDLTFIMMPEVIEKLSGRKFEEFVTNEVYRKIGAYDICFNPWKNYPPVRVVPTEYDSLFRKQLLHATVHDEGAAMLGGISGHAGLFATANDLLKLMELYRRKGSYGGLQLFDKSVMDEYISYQYPENNNRRGVGFDKPLVNNSSVKASESYPCPGASPSSFGHSGYTGTFVWIDPEKEITYVFLCNRVYPTRNNSLLSDLNIRTNILQAVYDSITENR